MLALQAVIGALGAGGELRLLAAAGTDGPGRVAHGLSGGGAVLDGLVHAGAVLRAHAGLVAEHPALPRGQIESREGEGIAAVVVLKGQKLLRAGDSRPGLRGCVPAGNGSSGLDGGAVVHAALKAAPGKVEVSGFHGVGQGDLLGGHRAGVGHGDGVVRPDLAALLHP